MSRQIRTTFNGHRYRPLEIETALAMIAIGAEVYVQSAWSARHVGFYPVLAVESMEYRVRPDQDWMYYLEA